MEDFVQSLLSLIRTVDEREGARRGVLALEESLYRAFPQEFNETIRTQFGARLGERIRDFFSTPSYLRNPDLIKADLKKVLSAMDAMRTLRLEVAVGPSEAFVDRIAGWALANLGSDIVLEIVEDRTVLGGTRIMFGGKYRASTLVDMVERVFETKRDILLKEFRL